jgi:hypothetical protein
MRVSMLIGATLLTAATALHAQTDDKSARREQVRQAHQKAAKACEGLKREERGACMQRELCAQAPDPKACNERVAKGKESFAKARKACEAKPESERRDCMRHELCAPSKDPAKCEAQAKEAVAARDKAREACKDKPADERGACMREHLGRKPKT